MDLATACHTNLAGETAHTKGEPHGSERIHRRHQVASCLARMEVHHCSCHFCCYGNLSDYLTPAPSWRKTLQSPPAGAVFRSLTPHTSVEPTPTRRTLYKKQLNFLSWAFFIACAGARHLHALREGFEKHSDVSLRTSELGSRALTRIRAKRIIIVSDS